MSISQKVKSVLAHSGKKQADLVEVLSMGSKQSLSNKFTHERWSADDLVKIADFCGCKLVFVLPDGDSVTLNQGRAEDQSV